jgi:predicted nucleic acid-binding protein
LNYILDTNIISELIKQDPDYRVVSFIDSLPEENIFLSVVTIGEIQFGIQKLPQSKRRDRILSWLETDLLARFENRIVMIDIETMLVWGEMSASLQALGTPMPIMDSLIAAICKTKNYTLVTRNTKDFLHLDIVLIDPFNV